MALNENKWHAGIRTWNILERRGEEKAVVLGRTFPLLLSKKRLALALTAALTHQSAPKKNGNISFLTQSGDG